MEKRTYGMRGLLDSTANRAILAFGLYDFEAKETFTQDDKDMGYVIRFKHKENPVERYVVVMKMAREQDSEFRYFAGRDEGEELETLQNKEDREFSKQLPTERLTGLSHVNSDVEHLLEGYLASKGYERNIKNRFNIPIGRVELGGLIEDAFRSKWGLTKEQETMILDRVHSKVIKYRKLPRSKQNIGDLVQEVESLISVFRTEDFFFRLSFDTDGTLYGYALYLVGEFNKKNEG